MLSLQWLFEMSVVWARMLDLADVMAVHPDVRELEMECVLHLPQYLFWEAVLLFRLETFSCLGCIPDRF